MKNEAEIETINRPISHADSSLLDVRRAASTASAFDVTSSVAIVDS